MSGLLDLPWLGMVLLLVLALLDYPLTAISRRFYFRYAFKYVDYRAITSGQLKVVNFWKLIGNVALVVLLGCIWLLQRGGSHGAQMMYLWLLGFCLGIYFIIDLRHVESILLSRLYDASELVSGKITIEPRLSMRISAVHFFSILLVIVAFLFYKPDYFVLGLACAPLFLIARNLILAS